MKNRKFLCKITFLTIYLSAAVIFAQAQDEEPPSRSISSLDFQTQRPKPPAARKSPKNANTEQPKSTPAANQRRRKNIDVLTNPGRRYDLVRRVPAARPKNSQNAAGGDGRGATPSRTTRKTNARNKPQPLLPLKNEKVGITFWRLREPKSYERDDAPTFPVSTDDGVEYWTAERVNSTTRFKASNRVRFTIESPRSGFLYVVNREYYTDGTRGEARLIFPTTKTRQQGDNRVTAGSLVEVPQSNSRVPYFTMRSKAPDYAGEEIIVIISPARLPGIRIGAESLPVTGEKLEKWI
ncbi:MAG TPA: hypothetical protein VK400_02860, partial [Pyrinomonadaceae bacterium]|nr:hypothetical protein [Pyrinomonadaceae bacterium]